MCDMRVSQSVYFLSISLFVAISSLLARLFRAAWLTLLSSHWSDWECY